MSITQHRRVIGSRSIFRFFLPPEGKPFRSSQFLLVEPADAGAVFRELPDDGCLTIVVDPDDYLPAHTALLSGPIAFWFLSRLALDRTELYREAPGLLTAAKENIEKRAMFLKGRNLEDVRSIVVSDLASYDFCLALGINSVLSPPPVSDEVYRGNALPSGKSLGWWTLHDSYSSKFLSVIHKTDGVDLRMTDSGVESMLAGNFSIVVHNPAVSGFPYEAAVSLAAGHTLIATELHPLWGLEPGIDFLEVSTPEELRYLVQSLLRGESVTQLLSFRGQRKAGVFNAERVFRELMGRGKLLVSQAGSSSRKR